MFLQKIVEMLFSFPFKRKRLGEFLFGKKKNTETNNIFNEKFVLFDKKLINYKI